MNKERIEDKVREIEEYLEELESILPNRFNEYEQNAEKRAACERYFEKIIEAAVDLAFLIIKNKNFKVPEEDKQSFDILAEEKIISNELSEKLKDAKGMRNVICHEYGKIDDELVFEAVTEQIIKDVKELIDEIKKLK